MGAGGQPRGGRAWLLCLKASSSGTLSFEDFSPASPAVGQDPRKVCSSSLAHPQCTVLKTVGGCVCVCLMCVIAFFLSVNYLTVFTSFTLFFYIITLFLVNFVSGIIYQILILPLTTWQLVVWFGGKIHFGVTTDLPWILVFISSV